MRRIAVLLSLIMGISVMMTAHSSWQQHADDMYAVFGFGRTPELTEWMRMLSSDMIDGYNKEKIYDVNGQKVGFYDYLKHKFPDFKCKHRLLFHWGYNSRPWTDALQQKVERYHWSEAKISQFQQELVKEQARRNRIANERTETLFGFAHSGQEAAKARALVSIAYDVHLLGDFTPDNSDLDGLCTFSSVVGDIINNLRVIDQVGTRSLVSQIQKLSRSPRSEQDKASDILELMKIETPAVLRKNPDRRISSLVE